MEEQDKKVLVFDHDNGEFVIDAQGAVKTATGSAAVPHIVIKAQQTRRGLFSIYANAEDETQHHKYGSDALDVLKADLDEPTRLDEIKRAIVEAIKYDPWVAEVKDLELVKLGANEYQAAYTVVDIFDVESKVEGVSI